MSRAKGPVRDATRAKPAAHCTAKRQAKPSQSLTRDVGVGRSSESAQAPFESHIVADAADQSSAPMRHPLTGYANPLSAWQAMTRGKTVKQAARTAGSVVSPATTALRFAKVSAASDVEIVAPTPRPKATRRRAFALDVFDAKNSRARSDCVATAAASQSCVVATPSVKQTMCAADATAPSFAASRAQTE